MVELQVLHLAIRWLHVAAMAVAFGGAVLVVVVAASARTQNALVQIGLAYEWAFWGAAGTLAMTGVGNLGAFGQSLPEPATAWGATLEVKLVVVLGLVLVSLPRTLAVARFASTGPMAGAAGVKRLRTVYGATVAAFAIVVALAVTLAHG